MHRTYRSVQAVQDISFQIAPGEIVGFLGPNGAGKTTTLKMLTGLIYPSAGRVRVAGHVPFRREVGFLGQDYARYGAEAAAFVGSASLRLR